MLRTLELTNFRSYKNGLFGFEPGVNIIVGANASGKTNLLEAIHTICTMHGFNAIEKNLIAIDSEWSRLEALTNDGNRVVKLQKDKSKTIELDGLVKKRLTVKNSLPVVVFEPLHMLLLSNQPERRRNYLDGILSLTIPSYKSSLLSYKRSLSQRNRLLKQEKIISDQLFAWDIQLSERAGAIVKHRYNLVKILNKKSSEHYKSISRNNDILELSYNSKLPIETYTNQLLLRLKNNIEIDRFRGFTGFGPHRDDLGVILNGTDARITASRGETRSIILALKINELEILQKHTGKLPILLLDDVFSELDGSRRRSLAENLQKYQTFLTTTDADIAIDYFSKSCNIIPL